MVTAHTIPFGEPVSWDPTTWGALVQGRSSILFAVLAGVSVALMTGGTAGVFGDRLREARTRLLVRAVLIFALGTALTIISSQIAIVLQVYAVLLVAVLPLLRWSVRRLLVLACILAVVSPVVNVYGAYGIDVWGGQHGEVAALFVGGVYPAVVWLTFTVVGLLVGRLDLSSVWVAARLLLVGVLLAVVGYAAGWATDGGAGGRRSFRAGSSPSGATGSGESKEVGFRLGTEPPDAGPPGTPVQGEDVDLSGRSCLRTPDDTIRCGALGDETPFGEAEWERPGLEELLGAAPHSATTFEVLGSGGFALAVLALCLLAPRGLRAVLYPVRAVGTVPLTLYVAHVVFFEVVGDRLGDHDREMFLAQAVVALAFASLWSRWRGQGPVEQLIATVARRTAETAPADRPAAQPGRPVG
ncbi:hypothetical protein Sked_06780 [Sanguibacter keddieii DSM 10542]|uniref:Heparan-alpha-glucosaminide N-acetyltransferase catalytic domain-containing protein n=2 Tax=Sanguibacter keddieii TaxID=60920 RepID=D1BB72_SANKS|nr:hypothetical protein Sked_06780 [Sanguibacter keddieii DSM 10542]